jgi:multidrug efflux system membrane fusion protein
MRRHLLSLAVPVALALVLAACGKEDVAAPPPRPAMVVQPQPASALSQSYPGEVHARLEPELAFRIGGKVTRRLVEVGDRVKKDQPLAELDPQDSRLQLEAARAQVAAAEANVQLAQVERDRYQTLLGRQMVSRSQFDTAQNSYRSAAARLKQARAEFEVANNQSRYTVLRASQTGVIARRLVEVGQVVAAGQTVFTLAADGEREVLINLPETAIQHMRLGQEVDVVLWSQPGDRLPGRIRELSPSADPQSRTFAARVAFSSDKLNAELGQSAQVFIRKEGQQALSVPLSAVTAEQGAAYVWVVADGGKVVRTPIRVGVFGQEWVTVLDGLKPQDWVVAAGVQMLLEGQVVRPVDRDNRRIDLVKE